ncbi:hypothetical protein HZY97_00100 [Sphingomonas sp. R-74633]|uniref:hypothetical protein n=1 Tax=Sphingomonas sp. R-74633 TaxID=2751188 RepID=UPI0015D2629F|nr:hypothetical protein [Sphingomonas sp. R-74633]NYT39143.1 hypothetical protein [Sphingomonas sp. R-74633]
MTGALPLLLAFAAWSGADEHGTQFGAMTLILNEGKRDPAALPILDSPGIRPQLQLRWKAPGGDMAVSLLDDGHVLQIEVRGHDCLQASSFYHYVRRTGEPGLWRAMGGQLHALARACPRVSAERRAALDREFAGTRDDFVAGVEAFKKRAGSVVAQDLKRCAFPIFPKGRVAMVPDSTTDRCGRMW